MDALPHFHINVTPAGLLGLKRFRIGAADLPRTKNLRQLTWVKDRSPKKGDDGTMNLEHLNMDALHARLRQVEAELAEVLQRMPAHSVKPILMAALLDLEDERDRLQERIDALAAGSP